MTNIKNLLRILFALSGAALLESNAQAQISLPDREHAQTIVWIVEAVTFAATIGIALFVWHISKRDRKTKDRGDSLDKSE